MSTTPEDGDYYNLANLSDIAGTASDALGSGVKEVQVMIKAQGSAGANFATWNGGRAGDSNDWDGASGIYWNDVEGLLSWTTGFPPLAPMNNRKFTIWVKAEDYAGNVSTAPSEGNVLNNTNADGTPAVQFYFDNSNPTSTLVLPAHLSVRGRPLLAISGTAASQPANVTAVNPTPLTDVKFRLQSSVEGFYDFPSDSWGGADAFSNFGRIGLDSWSRGSIPSDIFKDGHRYTFNAKAFDAAGNEEVGFTTQTFIVDFSTPASAVTFPANGGFV